MANVYDRASVRETLYRPYAKKLLYFNQNLNEIQYQLPQIFPNADDENKVICFSAPSTRVPFAVVAADQVADSKMFIDGLQCLPLYRYTAGGERVSNITEWGLRQFREHYGDDKIGSDDVFAYTYAMLHDPAYRQRYEVDLRREFPRVYFQEDFPWWVQQGRELLDMHLGFETAEPWPLERQDKTNVAPKRALLRAEKEKGIIRLDHQTTLAGVPPEAWEYQLGSRSALEWVLDQYKERKPRDPTIAERFNTYRFADHKERVIDLLGHVCTVSSFTTSIVNELGKRSSVEQESS